MKRSNSLWMVRLAAMAALLVSCISTTGCGGRGPVIVQQPAPAPAAPVPAVPVPAPAPVPLVPTGPTTVTSTPPTTPTTVTIQPVPPPPTLLAPLPPVPGQQPPIAQIPVPPAGPSVVIIKKTIIKKTIIIRPGGTDPWSSPGWDTWPAQPVSSGATTTVTTQVAAVPPTP